MLNVCDKHSNEGKAITCGANIKKFGTNTKSGTTTKIVGLTLKYGTNIKSIGQILKVWDYH